MSIQLKNNRDGNMQGQTKTVSNCLKCHGSITSKNKKVTTFKMLQKLTLHINMLSTVIQLVNVKSTPEN